MFQLSESTTDAAEEVTIQTPQQSVPNTNDLQVEESKCVDSILVIKRQVWSFLVLS